MTYKNDIRTVMTLDAGGTSLVFNAVQAELEILEPYVLPAKADSLEGVLKTIIEGFRMVENKLVNKPVASALRFRARQITKTASSGICRICLSSREA